MERERTNPRTHPHTRTQWIFLLPLPTSQSPSIQRGEVGQILKPGEKPIFCHSLFEDEKKGSERAKFFVYRIGGKVQKLAKTRGAKCRRRMEGPTERESREEAPLKRPVFWSLSIKDLILSPMGYSMLNK